MAQAVALGARHLGVTAPNPSVGAVLVDEQSRPPLILARAATAPSGRPHAERLALDAAGPRARGATLFVTLEPCAHHGRTPPCAEAVVAAGVARLVCGIEDPDARVAGKGFDFVKAAGIEVVTGVMAAECRDLHAGHILRVTAGRPFVTLKLAMTADGFAASTDGRRLRITGGIADAQTHLMRARADAILVGVGTVLADDPELTVRLPGLEARSPIRVVVDTRLRTPASAKLIASAGKVRSWIVAAADAPRDAEARLAQAGAQVLRLPAAADGRVSLRGVLQALAERGITRLMCEGGPELAEALAREELLDEIVLVTAPHALGAKGSVAVRPSLAAALSGGRFTRAEELLFGEDRWVRHVRSEM